MKKWLLLLTMLPLAALAENKQSYCNDRFGYCIKVSLPFSFNAALPSSEQGILDDLYLVEDVVFTTPDKADTIITQAAPYFGADTAENYFAELSKATRDMPVRVTDSRFENDIYRARLVSKKGMVWQQYQTIKPRKDAEYAKILYKLDFFFPEKHQRKMNPIIEEALKSWQTGL